MTKAITSLLEQDFAQEAYEIIVVDNQSTDNTRELVRHHFQAEKGLRYIYEPVLGLSQARNTGWKLAQGKYVAYLDDDAIAEKSWLTRIFETFESIKPMPGCVGGKIEAIWEAPRPPWLADGLLGYLAIIDWSAVPVRLNESQWLAGANIAFPRSLLERVGGFNTRLGRRGAKLLSAEETLLRWQLENLGHACYYHPEITVHHHITPSRLTKDWFLKRAYWGGFSEAVLRNKLTPNTVHEVVRRLTNIAVSTFLLPKNLVLLKGSANDPYRFNLKCNAMARIGYLRGMCIILR